MESGTRSEDSVSSAGRARAVFLDIDGTLVSGAAGPFDEDLRGIEAARRRGCRFFLNTGRSFAMVQPALLEAPYIDGVIAGCGGHVLLREGKGYKTIYRKNVSPETLRAAAFLYMELGRWCVFEGEEKLFVLNGERCSFPTINYFPVTHADDFTGYPGPPAKAPKYPAPLITKLTFEGETVNPGEEKLQDLRVFVQNGYHEGIIRGESKAGGMKVILGALGMRREDSVAIGDSSNDMDMILYAGLGAAMGNACEELKKAAGVVTSPCGEGGIAKVIERYILGTSKNFSF